MGEMCGLRVRVSMQDYKSRCVADMIWATHTERDRQTDRQTGRHADTNSQLSQSAKENFPIGARLI